MYLGSKIHDPIDLGKGSEVGQDEGCAASCFLYKENPTHGERGLDEVLEVT